MTEEPDMTEEPSVKDEGLRGEAEMMLMQMQGCDYVMTANGERVYLLGEWSATVKSLLNATRVPAPAPLVLTDEQREAVEWAAGRAVPGGDYEAALRALLESPGGGRE